MSKKMLKRSLALGALMAFVITGNAMAASGVVSDQIVDGTISGTDTLTITVSGDQQGLQLGNSSGTLSEQVTVSGFDSILLDGSNTVHKNSFNAYAGTNLTFEKIKTISTGANSDLSNTTVFHAQKGIVNVNANSITLNGVANGFMAQYGGELTVNANDVKVNAVNGNAMQASYLSSDTVGGTIVINANNVELVSATGAGISSMGSGDITINAEKKLVVTGSNAVNGNNGSIVLNSDEIIITNNGSYNALRVTNGGSVVVNGTNSVVIDGDILAEGYGGTINVNSDDVTKINGTVNITNGGGGGDTVNVRGKNITIDAGTDYGVSVRGGYYGFSKETVANIGTADTEKVTIKGSYGLISQYEHSDINVYGKELNIEASERGIYTGNNADCYNPTAEVNVYSEHTKITMAEGKNALVAFSDSTLNIHGGLEVKAKDAILVRGQSTVNVNKDGKGVVKIDGNINFNNQGSGVHTSANNNVNINMTTADSYLNGKIYVSNTLYENGVAQTPEDVGTGDFEGMTLKLSNGATWNVTGDSFVNNFTLSDGNIKHNVGNVTVNQINGSGNVAFAEGSGHLHIDAGSASLNLTMADQTADALNDAAGLTTVAEKLGVSKDATETVSAKVVMAEGDVKGETTGDVVFEDLGEDEYYHGEVKEVTEKVNTKNQAIGDAGIALKLHWRSHVNDMNKRMGELRNAEDKHGIWTRVVRGESEYENTKAQYNQYQLGYDEKLSVDERWTVGAAVTFAEGDANYGQGSTDDKSTAFAIYGSKLNNDGTFVDLIARYAHLESDLDDVNSGKGDYSTNGMSVSAEFGKRIQQGKGLWVEPQVELTYGTIDSAEFKFDGGKTVQVGDMDSLIGRVGFRIGKDLEQGNVYARASYLYDFEGETENTFSKGNASRTIAEDLGGGWWEVGVGANINLSKATYIYADVEKTFGGEVDTNWQWNLGVRYSF